MATKLKNLKITKVDFVDEGANPDAFIRLFKRRDDETDETGEGVPPAEDPEKNPEDDQGKKSIGKRIMDFLREIAGTSQDELDEAIETIEKAGSKSFSEEFNRRQRGKIMDDMWNLCYALNDSLCSILCDEELDASQKQDAMSESVKEFTDTAETAIKSWITGKPVGIIMKEADAAVTKSRVEALVATRDRLSEIITKSADGSEGEHVNEAMKGEDEDMKFDKSRMTPAERVFLEQIEKNYGSEEAQEAAPANAAQAAQATEPTQNGVTKSTKAPETAQEAPEADDIYKGMTPAAKAELEALKKFREEAEDRELHAIAKSYEIIGKKDEELFPILKSLKASSQEAYDNMISALDSAKSAVEKSGAFTEIGKSGNGTMNSDPWVEAESKAAEIMKNKTGINRNQALEAVFDADPDLAKKCKEV